MTPKSIAVYLAWLSGALFFLYQYSLRVAPGLMIDSIRSDFQIGAEQFATMGSIYLAIYALTQIPAGILVDKRGVRKIMILSVAMCSVSSMVFAYSGLYYIAQISRLFTGIGSSTALLCTLKIIADNMPAGKRGFFMGLTMAIGTSGAILFGEILKNLTMILDWRDIFYMLSATGAGLLVLVVLFVKNHNHVRPYQQDTGILKKIIEILSHRRIMVYGALAIGLFTPLVAFADLWGTAFLKQKFNLSSGDAASLSMRMYIGMTIGSLILPWIADKMGNINIFIIGGSAVNLILFSLLIYGPLFSYSVLNIYLITIGFICGVEVICFTGALQYAKSTNSGEIIGVVNTLNMLGGAILQQLVGFMLGLQWQGALDNIGLPHYTTENFINALTILVIVLTLCFILSITLFFKDRAKRIN